MSKQTQNQTYSSPVVEALKAQKTILESELTEIRQKIELEGNIRTLKRQILWGKIVLRFNRIKLVRFLKWAL